MVTLNAQVATTGFAIVWIGGKLARSNLLLPVRAAELVLEQLLAIQPVLHTIAIYHEQRRVPFVSGLDDVRWRWVQRVIASCRSQSAFSIRVTGVVEQLVLGSTPVDMVVFLGSTIEESGVPARTQLPVHRQLEVRELILGDEVFDRAGLGENTIDDPPARGHRLCLVSTPRIGVGAVEQRAPARRRLLSRQAGCPRRCASAARRLCAVAHCRAGSKRQNEV